MADEEHGGGIDLKHLTTKQKLIAGGAVVALGLGIFAATRNNKSPEPNYIYVDNPNADNPTTGGSNSSGSNSSIEQPMPLPSWWNDWTPSPAPITSVPSPSNPTPTPSPIVQAPEPTPVIATPVPATTITPVTVSYAAPITPIPTGAPPITIRTADTPVTPVTLPGLAVSPTTTFGVDQGGQVHVITGSATVGNGDIKRNGEVADALFAGIRNFQSGASSRIESPPQTTTVKTQPATPPISNTAPADAVNGKRLAELIAAKKARGG